MQPQTALNAIPDDLAGTARLDALIRAYISPHLRLIDHEDRLDYARLFSRLVVEPPELMRGILADVIGPVRRRFMDALVGTLPGIDAEIASRGLSFTVIIMGVAPFDPVHPIAAGAQAHRLGSVAMIDLVVAFAKAGFQEISKFECPPDR